MNDTVNARLTLLSEQSGGEKTCQSYSCIYKKAGDGRFIKYSDGGSAVMIRVSRDRAEIRRSGGESGLMMKIEPNRENTARIKTKYGDIEMNVRGISVEYSLGDGGGTARLCYDNGSRMTVTLTVEVL